MACVAILGFETWRIRSAFNVQTVESQTSAMNLAKSLAEQASGSFIQADLVLDGLVERLESDGTGVASIDRINRLLRSQTERLPQLGQLSVLDANAMVIATSLAGVDRKVSRNQREFFQYHQVHDDDALHLGPPIVTKTDNRWVLTVSRRFKLADGSFGGVVVATLQLNFFNNYYQQFDVGKNGSIVLAMSNGTILVRRPFLDKLIGTNLSNSVIFKSHIAFDELGVTWITSQIDGVARLTAYKKVGIFPAYAIVSYSKEQVFKDWKDDSIVHATAAILLVLLVAAIGKRLVSQIAQRHLDQLRLTQSQTALQQLNARLESLAREDGLTGLANRREFDRVLEDELKRAERSGEPLALIMLDIDRFKAFNDHFGHPHGDECIRVIASLIKQRVVRPGDMAARYGGEEFVILLPSTSLDGAQVVAEQLRSAIHARGLSGPPGGSGLVTVSMGISVRVRGDVPAANELLVRADNALYAAKAAGRDAIRSAGASCQQ